MTTANIRKQRNLPVLQVGDLNEQKLELSTVKRLTDELSRALAGTTEQEKYDTESRTCRARNFVSQSGLTENSRAVWLFACFLSLAARGLIPANLKNRSEAEIIQRLGKRFFGITQFRKDDCEMARSIGSMLFINSSENRIAMPENETGNGLDHAVGKLHELLSGTRKNSFVRAMTDALFAGWVYQYLLQQSEKELKRFGVAGGKTGSSPFYTKWFTPQWIADFLVEDALKEPNATFLDPACGAGHILVPALRRCVKLRVASGYSREEALQAAIESQIFGLEIDPELSVAAAFSLYLAARDIDATMPLHAANIFTFVEKPESSAFAASLGGSLCLGISSKTEQNHSVLLRRAGFDNLETPQRLPIKFGAIAANPPYMSMRNMPRHLAEFLKVHYPISKYDLYSAFIELAVNLLEDSARASLICQQSVLSISRYKPLRDLIGEKCTIETLIQLGSGSFPTRSGEKVNNAIITLRRAAQFTPGPNGDAASASLHFARILYPEEKKQAEILGIRSVLETKKSYTVMPNSESKTLMAPWCPPFVHNLFEAHAQLQNPDNDIVVVNGLFTCNNKLFVKTLDEVAPEELHEYVPYDKGGGRKWYHTTRYLLHWVDSGNVIREYRASRGQSRSLPGEDYYFKSGITYSYIGTQGFKARLLSPESIFDIASSSVFTPNNLKMYMLGFLNAALVRYLLGILNPTINFQIGDLRKLPYAKPDSSTQFAVSKLAQEAVTLALEVEKQDAQPQSNDFDEFLSWAMAKERVIQSDIDSQIFSLYEVPSKVQKQILNDPWVVRGQKNVFASAQKVRRHTAVLPVRF